MFGSVSSKLPRAVAALIIAVCSFVSSVCADFTWYSHSDHTAVYHGYSELGGRQNESQHCAQPLAFMAMLNKDVNTKNNTRSKWRRKAAAKRVRKDDAAVVLVNMCEDDGWETNTYTGVCEFHSSPITTSPFHKYPQHIVTNKILSVQHMISVYINFVVVRGIVALERPLARTHLADDVIAIYIGNYSVRKGVPASDAFLWPGGGMRYVNLQLVGSPSRAFDPFRCRYLDNECRPVGEPCSGVWRLSKDLVIPFRRIETLVQLGLWLCCCIEGRVFHPQSCNCDRLHS